MEWRWKSLPLLFILIEGALSRHWAAWMPASISAFKETCVAIPCSFNYPEDIRPTTIQGIWYFNSPYPKNFPPVVFKSKTSTAHEIYMGRTKMIGDLQESNCSIQIDRVSSELQGKYYFRADLGGYNQYTYSEHANLYILDEPFVVQPQEIISGSETEITCLVDDNCPDMKPTVTWMDIEGLEHHMVFAHLEENNLSWKQTSTLKFLPSHKNNGQRLGCRVTYPGTELDYKGFVTMDVKYAPRIVDINSSTETTEGTQLVFVCVVDSNPMSRVMWLKDDVVLKEDFTGNLTLELEYVTYNHDGVYLCAAENDYGRINKSMGLAVMYAPWKPSVNVSLVAIEGETVTMFCNTQGNPDPILSIVKDKQILNSVIFENELILEIPSVTHEHDGEYWCLAENQYGHSNSSFNLTVVFSPIVLSESKCTVTKDSVQCMCTVKSNPDPYIMFEIPEKNFTVSELNAEFVHSQRNGYTVSSILTLQKETELPKVVLCSASNLYGKKIHELGFQDTDSMLWAKIGPVGAVVVFVILVAVGGYMIKTREKKPMTESSSFIQTETSPSYSGDASKTKPLGKIENRFLSISERILLSKRHQPKPMDSEYANIDFSKRNVKDIYTSPEELTEYAEIRVK
ncbi:myelin-associated glycoprotein isoform X1 [Rana temporaria]|uniref:myelin-associated glycoprotein isoform X1 n=1 Tax=Rana temporaria TaxID=8407 RepID=UPI001AAC5A9E|nr:myelin-associated glycoprotein isoform X1 [Rana temporaria]XP_040183137.1 myelin-associated glycoprotein isoform X1 [Rana temporaria]XP_040183138.1 myelin-associated glycoprotein isoform X1 [Rana temporaria]XP_040183139.1 myelin-associated glycoprotein isoform X1 [Rana temporaria]